MLRTTANKFMLLGSACAVECSDYIQGAAAAPNCVLPLARSPAVQEKMMYLGLKWIMPARSVGRTRLREDRDVPTRLWSTPAAGSLRAAKTWSSLCPRRLPVRGSASTFSIKALWNQKQHISQCYDLRSGNHLGLQRLLSPRSFIAIRPVTAPKHEHPLHTARFKEL